MKLGTDDEDEYFFSLKVQSDDMETTQNSSF